MEQDIMTPTKTKRMTFSITCLLLCVVCLLIVNFYPTGNWVTPVLIGTFIFPPLLFIETILCICTYFTSSEGRVLLIIQSSIVLIHIIITTHFLLTSS